MKTLRLLLVLIATGLLTFAIVRHARAQTNNSEDRGVLGQYEQLVISLSKRGDTNTVKQIVSLTSAMQSGRNATDIVTTIHVLEGLRAGHTNEAIQFLEGQLDGALMFFGAPSESPHDPKYDTILKMAEEYRSKYPHKGPSPGVDALIQKAFDSVSK